MYEQKDKEYCVKCGIKIKKGIMETIVGKPDPRKPVEYKEGWYCFDCHEKKRRGN